MDLMSRTNLINSDIISNKEKLKIFIFRFIFYSFAYKCTLLDIATHRIALHITHGMASYQNEYTNSIIFLLVFNVFYLLDRKMEFKKKYSSILVNCCLLKMENNNVN